MILGVTEEDGEPALPPALVAATKVASSVADAVALPDAEATTMHFGATATTVAAAMATAAARTTHVGRYAPFTL